VGFAKKALFFLSKSFGFDNILPHFALFSMKKAPFLLFLAEKSLLSEEMSKKIPIFEGLKKSFERS
jgi:hypothetical protein